MNLKIIFLCINTVTAVTAHNHLRHKPEQDQITSFQNTKGELSRLLLLKGSDRFLGGSKDLGSCSDDKDCKGDNQECKSSSKEDEDGECECEKDYQVVDGVCVPKEDNGGSGGDGGAVAASKVLSDEDQAVLNCYEGKDTEDALDTDDEKKAEQNLKALDCGVDESDEDCVLGCIKKIGRKCKDHLNGSGSGSGDDDCKKLADDFVKCLEEDCYPAEY